MNQAPVLASGDAVSDLARRLSRCERVARFDTDTERQGSTLAHSFSDLEGSFRKFLLELLPRLTAADSDESEIERILLDIGEEFRHILYHIRDPRYYRYIDEREFEDK